MLECNIYAGISFYFDLMTYIIFTCFFHLVPFCVTNNRKFRKFDHDAALCDVATTVLQEMGVALPAEMTGKQLLE